MRLCCGGEAEVEEFQPVKPRGCTDTLCLALFFLFWAVLIFLAAFAFVVGNPRRLVHGYDSFGNICGMSNEQMGNLTFSGMDMRDRPYVFYLNMGDISHSLKICVKQCPDKVLHDPEGLRLFEEKTGASLCRYDSRSGANSILYPNDSQEQDFNARDGDPGYGVCPKLPLYPTKKLMNRCVPDSILSLGLDTMSSIYGYLNSFDVLQQVVSDLYASWKEIIGMIFLAVVLSFIMVVCISVIAAIVPWLIMAAVGISSVILTGVLWWTYADIKWGLDSTRFEQLLEESAKNERAFLTFAIISTIISTILLLIMLAMRKRVSLAIALFREAGNCVRSIPCLLLQPVWTFVALMTFFIFWLAVLLALATSDYPTKTKVFIPYPAPVSQPANNPMSEGSRILGSRVAEARDFTLVTYGDPSWVRYMWWFHVIALVWISEFILACQQMVIAGAVASWYFTRDRETLHCPVGRSAKRLLFYHLGTVALGSFLITLFKIPRLILAYMERKLQRCKENPISKFILRCCHCCLWCLTRFLKYLNHNAYTVVAIEGTGFCISAKVAFSAVASNVLRVITINSVGDFILFLGKCGVTAITCFVGVLLMKHDPELHFYAIPVLVVCVFAFFIAHCVLSVYEMVVDTLFLCYCEDQNKNDGSRGKEYYAPPSLMAFLKNGTTEDDGSQPLKTMSVTEKEPVEAVSV